MKRGPFGDTYSPFWHRFGLWLMVVGGLLMIAGRVLSMLGRSAS